MWPGLDSGRDPVCDASLLVIYSALRGYFLGTSGTKNQKPKTKTCSATVIHQIHEDFLLLSELPNFLSIIILTTLLFLPHTSQPCLEP